MCEDYPCCGHNHEDPCPRKDAKGKEYHPCVTCGKRLSPRSESSFCPRCYRNRRWIEDEDFDYSMNS